jgi:polysaccharide export outer membrane protein
MSAPLDARAKWQHDQRDKRKQRRREDMNLRSKTVVSALVLLVSLALAQEVPPPASGSVSDSAASSGASSGKLSSVASQGQSGSEYVIGPEDVLHIAVWKESDLTATLPVRPDGKISLPLLNDVQASGLTPLQLASSLTEKLKKYIADPRVTVVVTTINSKKI